MSMKEIKWGIIGPGSIAKEFVKDLELIHSEKHVVTSLLGNTKEKAYSFQKEFNIESVFFNIEEMVQHRNVDIVYIASPHPLHYDQCLALLKAQIPVLCEKPLAINEKQVSAIIKASQDQRTFLMEGIWSRFLPSMTKILEFVQSGLIGEINSIEASMTYKAPFDPESRYFNPKLGGGSLLDLGVYPIYLSYLLLGKPSGIQSFAKMSATKVDEACVAILSYPNGAYASVESSLIKQSPIQATIFGEKGTIQVFPPWTEKPEKIVVTFYDDSSLTYIPEWKGRGLYYEVTEVVKCLSESKIESEMMNHETSLEVIRILDEIRRQTNIKYPDLEQALS